MRQRVCSFRHAFVLAALAFSLVPAAAAVAQEATTISIKTPTAEIDGLLAEGRRLETERRWGDALSHYEDAVRRFPHEHNLQRQFDFARLHYDLGRRYADHTFREAVAKLTVGAALDLYSQVLLKIESHYVESPDWADLLDRGTDNLEVALSEPAFVEHQLAVRDRPAAGPFCAELRRTLGRRNPVSRGETRDIVAAVAAIAQQRLNIRPTAVVLEYLCGATNTLDPYSSYLTPGQLNEVYSQIDGNFVGLGIELKSEAGRLLIVRVIPGSPAATAGMVANDSILAVDGQPTENLTTDQAANLLQGVDGSIANLVVVTPGYQPRDLRVQRRRVDVPSIEDAEIIDRNHGVGYFRLACFQKTTCRDMESALWRLHRAGMRSLIIDLRRNPGGLLLTAVEVVDKFVDRGTIVSTRGRSAQENFTYTAHEPGTWRVPLVVMIDKDSASAAEIFAGAIRDHRRGKIVGVRSYGKGSVQGIFPLDITTAGVRLTTAKFYSPAGRPYSRIGVEPDVLVHTVARPTSDTVVLPRSDDDAMLAAALQEARKLIPRRQARN